AFGVPNPRELPEHFASLGQDLAHELRITRGDGTDRLRIVPCACGEELLDSSKLDGYASAREQLQHVTASSSRREAHRRFAKSGPVSIGAPAHQRRVSAMVQQQLEDFEGVVAQRGVMERCLAPM